MQTCWFADTSVARQTESTGVGGATDAKESAQVDSKRADVVGDVDVNFVTPHPQERTVRSGDGINDISTPGGSFQNFYF